MTEPLTTSADAGPAAPLPTAPAAWAEVRARDSVMRYRRSGVGRTVLVLLPAAGEATALWPELLEELFERHRLIVPEMPEADDAHVAGWLQGFLEGLGVREVTVVAAAPFVVPAFELALCDADQVARLVLVPEGLGDPEGLDGAIATRAREGTLPFLLVRRELPAETALPRILGFLDGRSGDAAGTDEPAGRRPSTH